MKINDIETSRLLLRGFTKEDALWAYSIWNDPEMGKYLPDEAKEEIDDFLWGRKMLHLTVLLRNAAEELSAKTHTKKEEQIRS